MCRCLQEQVGVGRRTAALQPQQRVGTGPGQRLGECRPPPPPPGGVVSGRVRLLPPLFPPRRPGPVGSVGAVGAVGAAAGAVWLCGGWLRESWSVLGVTEEPEPSKQESPQRGGGWLHPSVLKQIQGENGSLFLFILVCVGLRDISVWRSERVGAEAVRGEIIIPGAVI